MQVRKRTFAAAGPEYTGFTRVVGVQAMSIADNFENKRQAGFIRSGMTGQAQRQFQVSLALVVILALAATSVSLSLWLENSPHVSALAQIFATG